MDMNINSDLLKKLRLSKSWSQEQLAEESGLSLRTVQRIESEGIASLQSRKAISQALGVDPSMLDLESNSENSQNTESLPKPMNQHVFTPRSPAGYYLLVLFRSVSVGALWLILASNAFFGVVLLLGSIFYWELTPFTALQSAGAGIISTLLIVVPGHLVFVWLYKHAKRMEIVQPIEKDSISLSKT
ncbi:MAG: hypothetical protein DHS20C12_06180 [Pseudohongiella sp.]|nr:MAG: hypothetical protein DHS20C12_06180 [Pseudohongiella sp.]